MWFHVQLTQRKLSMTHEPGGQSPTKSSKLLMESYDIFDMDLETDDGLA
jgi:hypothetical protein